MIFMVKRKILHIIRFIVSFRAIRPINVWNSWNPLLFGLVMVILLGGVMTGGCNEKNLLQNQGGSGVLIFLVDDPNQLDNVREIAVKYQNETGTLVSVESVPKEWSPSSSTLLRGDLLVADASRIPVFASDEVLMRLNPLLNTSNAINWTLFESPPLVFVGEFPDRSGDIYALPFFQDALGIVYRADLFSNPDESAAFCQTYGYPIGIPGTYNEVTHLATHFTRKDSNLYGIGFAGLEGPDRHSSPWLSILISYGSGVVDPSSGTVSGVWNSSKTLSALTKLRNFSALMPDNAGSWGDAEVQEGFSSGRIAMAVTWFSLFPKIFSAAEENNLSTGFIPLPGEIVGEESHRGITISMDGIGLVQGGSNDEGLRFLEWFYSPKQQIAYASSGHQPSLLPVLDSFTYLSLNSYNRGFPESMRMGVISPKGENAEEIRQVCENTIRDILSAPDSTPRDTQHILDASVARIESLILH
jgi:ABC-type glycerol-3-phosphate transport system substrate-binding protein